VSSWYHNSAFAAVGVLALSSIVNAQSMSGGILGPSASVKPPGLTNVGIEQRLNEQVPLDLAFRDDTGKAVKIGDYLGKKPVILSLVYYRCPMLCNELLVGLESAL
jgi:protein SCO1/2